MDKQLRSVLRYHPSVVNFDEDLDVLPRGSMYQWVLDNAPIANQVIKNRYYLLGERNGTVSAGTRFAFGNGASPTNVFIVPRDCKITRLGLATDGIASSWVGAVQVNGVNVQTFTFNGSGGILSPEYNIDVAAGSVLGLVGVSGSSTGTNRFYVELTEETELTGFKGEKGEKGEKGDDGVTFNDTLFGNGAPSSGLGNDGDVYIDGTTTSYYKKVAGVWLFQFTASIPSLVQIELTPPLTQDLNTSTPTEVLFLNQSITTTDITQLENVATRVLCKRNGIVNAYFNIGVSSNNARTNLIVQIVRNRGGVLTNFGAAKSFYVRASNGHNESSGSLFRKIAVEAGDELYVTSIQEGAAGTVSSIPSECTFGVEYTL